jgi:AMMECR1 domain-containing protein
MKTRYSVEEGPDISVVPFNSHLQHGHYKEINYTSYRLNPYGLRQAIDQETTRVKGCIGFFESYAKKSMLSAKTKAAIAGAIAEDQERLQEMKRHRP